MKKTRQQAAGAGQDRVLEHPPPATRRDRLLWLVLSVWAATAALLAGSLLYHPPARAAITLSAEQISLPLGPSHSFNAASWDEVRVNRIANLRERNTTLRIRNAAGEMQPAVDALGGSYGSCGIRSARLNELKLETASMVKLRWSKTGYALETGGSRATAAFTVDRRDKSDVAECTGMQAGTSTLAQIAVEPRDSAVHTLDVTTSSESIFNFAALPSGAPAVLLSSVPLTGELTVGVEEESAEQGKPRLELRGAVIQPPSDRFNGAKFEGVPEPVRFQAGDIVTIEPVASECYVGKLYADHGLQLYVEGKIKDLETGAGPRTLAPRMPNLFDHLDGKARFFAAIPALAGALLEILRRMRLL